jgi:hypothetical protein
MMHMLTVLLWAVPILALDWSYVGDNPILELLICRV